MITEKEINIEDMIYEIRGKQVMLDSDLAKLFSYETFNLNKAVKRNMDKFNNDYMFQITLKEYKLLIFQNGISNSRGGRRTLPYAFTEKGILMLATILKSKIAVEMSINIINVFVEMRKYLSTYSYEKRIGNIETKIIDYDNKFDEVLKKLDNTVNNHIFFEGQIYDAYSKIIDIFNTSKSNITIIDNYLDKDLLDVISKTNVEVTLITADKLDNLDLVKYKKQYNNLNIIINKSYHDRFIIIDSEILYHLGASLNSIGKKCFAITRIEDKDILDKLLERGINDNRKN